MARVVVTDDSGNRVLMDELVQRFHLADRHSSAQVIERLAWAVEDAEGARRADEISSAAPRRSRQRRARHMQTA